MTLINKFLKNIGGNFALVFALGSVPIFGSLALAMDYGIIYQKRSELQAVADIAALSSVKEFAITSTKNSDIQSIAENYASAEVDAKTAAAMVVLAKPSDDGKTVKVDISYTWEPFIAHFFDARALPIKVSATAALAGKTSQSALCVIALNPSSSAMAITGSADLFAKGCSIQSNSTATNAVTVHKMGKMAAANIFSSGGYSATTSNIDPVPIIDSPPILDPLRDRPLPTAGTCDYNNKELYSGKAEIIDPGTYCGGIFIMSGTDVVLNPGVYIMKDGPLDIVSGSLKGENVGIHFEGAKSFFDFVPTSILSLTAPKTGIMAGILFSEDRAAPLGREFVIRSKNAERLEGAIYLPRAHLVVEKASRIGQASKWTAIIANEIEIKQGPELEINSDYAGSTIPVPEGLIPTETTTESRLVK
jgi:Flp pilus assembly protein TadG